MIKKILVAYDGSSEAHAAFLFGLELAKKLEAELHVLSVVRMLEPPEEVEAKASFETGKDHYEKLFKLLKNDAKDAGVRFKGEVVLGHPAEQIIYHAEKVHVDIIVIAHQTRSTFGKWLLGSVPGKVVDHAHCTVVVFKEPMHMPETKPEEEENGDV